jgi:predicted dehydrogenase
MSLKCAMLGCGPRAQGHAKAYSLVERGTLAVLCDMNEERLNSFGEQYGVAARYTDLDEMLAREQPDVVHLVTPPTLRVGLMTRLSDAGVPGVIVEKPICIGADDYKALRKLEAASKTKFAVNHQLRHHPRVLEYLEDVAEGKIGEVRVLGL